MSPFHQKKCQICRNCDCVPCKLLLANRPFIDQLLELQPVKAICSRTGVTLHDLEGCENAVEDLHEGFSKGDGLVSLVAVSWELLDDSRGILVDDRRRKEPENFPFLTVLTFTSVNELTPGYFKLFPNLNRISFMKLGANFTQRPLIFTHMDNVQHITLESEYELVFDVSHFGHLPQLSRLTLLSKATINIGRYHWKSFLDRVNITHGDGILIERKNKIIIKPTKRGFSYMERWPHITSSSEGNLIPQRRPGFSDRLEKYMRVRFHELLRWFRTGRNFSVVLSLVCVSAMLIASDVYKIINHSLLSSPLEQQTHDPAPKSIFVLWCALALVLFTLGVIYLLRWLRRRDFYHFWKRRLRLLERINTIENAFSPPAVAEGIDSVPSDLPSSDARAASAKHREKDDGSSRLRRPSFAPAHEDDASERRTECQDAFLHRT